MAELIHVEPEIDLMDIILEHTARLGFPFDEYKLLTRKYNPIRIPIVFETGTDRDDNSAWHCQDHYPNIQNLGLTAGQITFLNKGLQYSMLYRNQAMSVYNPEKIRFVGGEGWMYSAKPPHSFKDALIMVLTIDNACSQ